MLEVFTSRSGSPSLRVDGLALHSPYDPAREAERFVESALGQEPPSLVVILGEGLGYLTRRLSAVHPTARVLRVYYSAGIFQCSLPVASGHQETWHPGLGISVDEFLRQSISELEVEGLRVLEWPPSARLFPEISQATNMALQQCLRELNGSLVTTMSMGRLWLRNSVFNFLSFDELLRGVPCARERTVVIAASGPSLESAAPLLPEIRNAADVWALPSSVSALARAGVKPDLIVMTDPGYYAIRHLYNAAPGCPVAMPLSAARGLWDLPTRSNPPLPFLLSQPGMLEDEFLRSVGAPAPVVTPHGTVAATALDLALTFTDGPVVFAGLDMCTKDVLSHARPNEFEQFFFQQSSRLNPYDGFWHRRSVEQNAVRVPGSDMARAPLPLRTYAGWLGRGNPAAGERVYRLLPSSVPLAGMRPLDAKSLRDLAESPPPCAPGPRLSRGASLLPRAERVSLVAGVIGKWRGILAQAQSRAQGPEGYAALAQAPVFAIVRQLAARSLLETRRRARLGDEKGARESTVVLLDECGQFLLRLEEKARDAA